MKVTPHKLKTLGSKCYWCPTIMSLDVPDHHPTRATVDHIRCKAECESREEYVDLSNRVLACHRCNQERNKAFITNAIAAKRPTYAVWDGQASYRRQSKLARRAKREAKAFTPEVFDPFVLSQRKDTVFSDAFGVGS